jgi:two-component system, LytTR family, response regulator
MMRILLVDDEPLAIERLQVALVAVPDAEVVGTASHGSEAVEKIATLRPDLVMLDVQMPGLSGIEVAEALTSAKWRPDVVFVTAFDHFAIEAFGVDATDYLLKPVSFDRLRIAVERVRRRQQLIATTPSQAGGRVGPDRGSEVSGARYPTGLWVPCPKGSVWVPVETIDRIESSRDYVLINTSVKSYIMRAKMSDLERRIDPAIMMRVHRSHIVRLRSVVGIERPGRGSLRLLLADGTNLQVGPNYHEQVVTKLRDRLS